MIMGADFLPLCMICKCQLSPYGFLDIVNLLGSSPGALHLQQNINLWTLPDSCISVSDRTACATH